MDDMIKLREVLFDALHPDRHQARTASRMLQDVDGVHRVRPDAPLRLLVTYDLTRITLADIEARLQQAGLHLDNCLLSKLRRALYHYAEETARANLGCQKGRSNCTRQVFVQSYISRPHGCRDRRPEHWRHYL